MDLKLTGKTALVTGSTAGIGFGIARRLLLQEGANNSAALRVDGGTVSTILWFHPGFMPTADTIIFDLGGVLIDWNPEYLYRKIFSNENDLRYFLENICTSAWNQEQDAGYPLAQATA